MKPWDARLAAARNGKGTSKEEQQAIVMTTSTSLNRVFSFTKVSLYRLASFPGFWWLNRAQFESFYELLRALQCGLAAVKGIKDESSSKAMLSLLPNINSNHYAFPASLLVL